MDPFGIVFNLQCFCYFSLHCIVDSLECLILDNCSEIKGSCILEHFGRFKSLSTLSFRCCHALFDSVSSFQLTCHEQCPIKFLDFSCCCVALDHQDMASQYHFRLDNFCRVVKLFPDLRFFLSFFLFNLCRNANVTQSSKIKINHTQLSVVFVLFCFFFGQMASFLFYFEKKKI